jgi:hypothetical protein
MASPDPKTFAKHILWHLAALRADMEQIRKYLLTNITASSPNPQATADLFDANWKQQHEKIRDAIYKHALKEAGLSDGANDQTPPSNL